MLDSIIMILPTVLAVLSLAMFNERTRRFCYTLAIISIISELVPLQINTVALTATSSVFVALVALDLIRRSQRPKKVMVRSYQQRH